MWLVAVDYERVSVVPTGEGVVGIAVPVIVVACTFYVPALSVAIQVENEFLGCLAPVTSEPRNRRGMYMP